MLLVNKRIFEPQQMVVIVLVELSIKLGECISERIIASFTYGGNVPSRERTLPSYSD
jgi:hypothetical protein